MLQTDHRIVFANARDLGFIPSESVALVVTSPPYPMIEMWDELFGARSAAVHSALEAGEGRAAFRLMHEELDPVWAEVHRVLIAGGFACINIGDATRAIGGGFQLYPNHARILQACLELGFEALPLILWRKQTNAPNKFMGSGMLPAGAYVTLEHEYILILRKGGKRQFKLPAERLNRRQSAFFWEERNTWFSDVWDFKGARQGLNHREPRGRSAAFPFELAWRLIHMYSAQGDTVLDPFLGTGTTVLAAAGACRNSIGVEIDPGFAPLIEEGLARALPLLNRAIEDRLRDHLEFVEKHAQARGPLGHRNAPYGFPVMTAQETGLRLPYLRALKKEAEYRWRAEYLEEPRMPGPAV